MNASEAAVMAIAANNKKIMTAIETAAAAGEYKCTVSVENVKKEDIDEMVKLLTNFGYKIAIVGGYATPRSLAIIW